MAFRRRFAPFRGRSASRGNSKQIPRWTAQSVEQILTAAAPAQRVLLYSPGTTIGTGVYEEESKLVRIVGRYTVQPLDNATVLTGAVGAGIAKSQFGAAPTVGGAYDPLVANELATRDWIHVMNVQLPPQSGPNGWQWIHELDIKVQRRLKAEDSIALYLVNGVGDDIVITIDIRILIVIRL